VIDGSRNSTLLTITLTKLNILCS